MELPDSIAEAVQPLFDALPLHEAMPELTPRNSAGDNVKAIVRSILKHPAISARPALQSALWLYVDELDLSHNISQTMADATGSYWHGIMHRREGDFSNSHYWFDRTGRHPAMAEMPGYDGHALIEEVASSRAANPREVVQKQREEWANLFAWCAANT